MAVRVATTIAAALALCAPMLAHAGEQTSPFQAPNVTRGRYLGGELHLGSIDPPLNNLTVIGIELFGEIPFGDRSSFRARMPLAHVQGDNDSGTGLGNLTLGMSHAMGARRTPGRTTRWAISGSLSLPTASDDGDAGVAAGTLALYRVPYPGYYAPNATTLRVGVDSHMDFGTAFAQVSVGLRLIAIDNSDNQTPIHLGLAAGAKLNERFSLVGELTTMSYIISNDGGEDWLHTLDAGLKYRTGNAVIGGRIYVPLDDSYRDGLSVIGLAVDVTSRY